MLLPRPVLDRDDKRRHDRHLGYWDIDGYWVFQILQWSLHGVQRQQAFDAMVQCCKKINGASGMCWWQIFSEIVLEELLQNKVKLECYQHNGSHYNHYISNIFYIQTCNSWHLTVLGIFGSTTCAARRISSPTKSSTAKRRGTKTAAAGSSKTTRRGWATEAGALPLSNPAHGQLSFENKQKAFVEVGCPSWVGE